MTILPKKKPAQPRNEVETSSESTTHHNHSHPSTSHHNHPIPLTGNQHTQAQNSPPHWQSTSNPRPSEDKRVAHTSHEFEFDALDSGPSQSKRRMRASPHRSVRSKHRDRERERAAPSPAVASTSASVTGPPANLAFSPVPITNSTAPIPSVPGPSATLSAPPEAEEDGSGYNSGDEYGEGRFNASCRLTDEEWVEKERLFEKKLRKRGLVIKQMGEDGACLFRAVADQIYGDQDMHSVVRRHCMDYIAANSDYFSQYLTEDVASYVSRKRRENVHGNHIEMQAMCEMYNRPVEVFCYSSEPANVFYSGTENDNEPIRLSYHRCMHYNSLVDPYKATVGVGLGLPGLVPGAADKSLMNSAITQSEEMHIEQAMFEDKLKATDWEATNEAIEEQIARESYLDWLRENERRGRQRSTTASCSATITSGELRSPRSRGPGSGNNSPLPRTDSPLPGSLSSSRNSPKADSFKKPPYSFSPQPHASSSCSVSDSSPANEPETSQAEALSVAGPSSQDWGLGPEFRLSETASFMGKLPPDLFGLSEWEDAGILAQVLAASQQEYLDSLKKSREETAEEPTAPKEDNINSA